MLTKIYQEGVEVERVVVQQDSPNVACKLEGAASHDTAHVSPRLVADALCDVNYHEECKSCEKRRVRSDTGQVLEDADVEGAARYAELAVCARAEADRVEVIVRHGG